MTLVTLAEPIRRLSSRSDGRGCVREGFSVLDDAHRYYPTRCRPAFDMFSSATSLRLGLFKHPDRLGVTDNLKAKPRSLKHHSLPWRIQHSGIFSYTTSNGCGRTVLRRSPSDTVVIDGRMKEAALKRRLRGVSKSATQPESAGAESVGKRNRACLVSCLIGVWTRHLLCLKIMRIPL